MIELKAEEKLAIRNGQIALLVLREQYRAVTAKIQEEEGKFDGLLEGNVTAAGLKLDDCGFDRRGLLVLSGYGHGGMPRSWPQNQDVKEACHVCCSQ